MSIRTIDEWQADWMTVSLVRFVDEDGAERECCELSCGRCGSFSCGLSSADLDDELATHRGCTIATHALEQAFTPQDEMP